MQKRKKRHQNTVAVYGILRKDERILLTQRSSDRIWGAGMWSLPAGHLEAKEAPDEAVVRELKEEIGVDTTPENCRLVCAIASQIDTPYLCLFFEITRWEGEPKNIASNEHEKIEWFLESKLPDNLVPELKNYLKAKAEGRCGAIEYR